MFDCSGGSEYSPILRSSRTPLASQPLNLPSITSDGPEIRDCEAISRRNGKEKENAPQLVPQVPWVPSTSTLESTLIQNPNPLLGLENLDRRISLDLLIGKIKRDYERYTSSPDLLFLQQQMPDWKSVPLEAELKRVVQSLPWQSNSCVYAPRTGLARTQILQMAEYEVYLFHVWAHLLTKCSQVRRGILSYFLARNGIGILCECYACNQLGSRTQMSYVDFFHHILQLPDFDDALSNLESPIRFIKIKDTQFDPDSIVKLKVAEEILTALRFPPDVDAHEILRLGKAFECRCGGASVLGSPIALSFEELVHHISLYKRSNNVASQRNPDEIAGNLWRRNDHYSLNTLVHFYSGL